MPHLKHFFDRNLFHIMLMRWQHLLRGTSGTDWCRWVISDSQHFL